MSVHLVLYSQNEPFDTTKRLIIESVPKCTKRNFIIHDYNLEKIQRAEWYPIIERLRYIKKSGKRDGYYCAYKPFCCYEVYNSMTVNDILYYVDCSQYFRIGFTESIDKLCDIVNEKLFIAGSVGDDVRNNSDIGYDSSKGCCDNIAVWNKIIENNDNRKYLNDRHVLASWFILKKTDMNTAFMNEWIKWCMYNDSDMPDPLITYHHTVDQSIFNILVHKYDLLVFYHKNRTHNDNKDKNLILHTLNNTQNTDEYFIHL